MGDFHEAVLFIKPMCAQKLLGRSKQYFGNASFVSVRNERCKQFARGTEFGTAISLGDKHFPQSSLTLPYILEGYGADDVTIGFGYPKFTASLTIEPLHVSYIRLVVCADRNVELALLYWQDYSKNTVRVARLECSNSDQVRFARHSAAVHLARESALI